MLGDQGANTELRLLRGERAGATVGTRVGKGWEVKPWRGVAAAWDRIQQADCRGAGREAKTRAAPEVGAH